MTCRWCLRPATGIVTAGSKPKVTIAHCDQHWDDAYREVKDLLPRTWKLLDTQPTLF